MSGQRSSRDSKFSEKQINELVSRLQLLLPQLNNQRNNSMQSASKILQETLNHIRRLQKEVEEISEKLTQLMDSVDINDIDRRTLENFLQY
uniref:Transcription factor PRE6-like n=1 Tax=Cicer arietinum TaxID=3827 RepID=A0A1S2Z5U0_CICAR|nr:transcription factor PRE6-like [Cicer arietinum]